tara:strand:- start:1196 stop:1681 length:486 start_codon:yes stop_codon:yes gene_type:complete
MALSTIGTNSIADSAVTAAKATGFGKIGQVQSASFTDDISTNSSSVGATVITDAITPSATSSKILIMIDGGRTSFSGGAAEGTYWLYRSVGGGSFAEVVRMKQSDNNESGNYSHTHAFNYVHSPSTTSELVYKVYFNTNANTYFFNSSNSRITITLMEILA